MEKQVNKAAKKIAGKTKLAVFLVIIIIVLIVLAVRFIQHRLAYAITDAVFVSTDSLTSVSFDRVSGRLIKLYKQEGDTVHRGEVLAVLDDEIYRLKRDRLAARLAEATGERQNRFIYLDRLKKEVALNESIAHGQVKELTRQVAALTAKAASAEAHIQQIRRDKDRFAALYKADVISSQQLEQISTNLTAKKKAKKALEEQAAALKDSMGIARDRVKLAEAAKLRIQETEGEIKTLNDKVKGLTAALKSAEQDVVECKLRSPIDGRVAKRFFAEGSIIPSERQVFSLVNPKDLYIKALLEENKLQGVKPDAPVNISIDAYPDQSFSGKVEKIMPASAATFALAPRDISAGEFTKVAQRIPIRITITKGDISILRVGLGGSVEIKRQ
jgi:membrane fusion protein (multidrug efflux system)